MATTVIAAGRRWYAPADGGPANEILSLELDAKEWMECDFSARLADGDSISATSPSTTVGNESGESPAIADVVPGPQLDTLQCSIDASSTKGLAVISFVAGTTEGQVLVCHCTLEQV